MAEIILHIREFPPSHARNSFFFSSSLFYDSCSVSLSLSLSLRTINTSSAQPLCLLLFPKFESSSPIDTHPLRYRRCSSFPLQPFETHWLGKDLQFWWQAINYARLNHSTITFFNFSKPETAASRQSRVRLNASKVGKGLSKDTKAQKLAFQHWIEAVALAKDLYRLVVICPRELSEEPSNSPISGRDLLGLHCLVLDTSIFWKSHRVQVV